MPDYDKRHQTRKEDQVTGAVLSVSAGAPYPVQRPQRHLIVYRVATQRHEAPCSLSFTSTFLLLSFPPSLPRSLSSHSMAISSRVNEAKKRKEKIDAIRNGLRMEMNFLSLVEEGRERVVPVIGNAITWPRPRRSFSSLFT